MLKDNLTTKGIKVFVTKKKLCYKTVYEIECYH